jgi:hypothetical protein
MAVKPLIELGYREQTPYDDSDGDDFDPDIEGNICSNCGVSETVGWKNLTLIRWFCNECEHLWDEQLEEATTA